jgi:hypothetical protein
MNPPAPRLPAPLASAPELREASLPMAGELTHVTSRPPPTDRWYGAIVYGLWQPLLGARLLIGQRALLRAALVPVGLLAAFCALWATGGFLLDLPGRAQPLGPVAGRALRDFYKTFAVLAPLPTVLMAGHYTRLVVRTRECLQLPPAEPPRESIWRALWRAVAQAILIAVALAPATLLFRMVPLLGQTLVRVTAAAWALHWIVVDAFDGTRVTPIGAAPASVRPPHSPWFVRLLRGLGRVPLLGWPVRRLASLCDRLARPWHDEIAVVEQHPAVVLGFALATAALLATPVLNLFFRPIVLIGAVRVLAWLEGTPSDQA